MDCPLDRQAEIAFARSYVGKCAKFWADRGVDLSGYNVLEMASDVDAIRQALGYEKIKLLASSFGSHHCIAVLKLFGEHIDRAVMTSVEGPAHTIKLPSNVQQHLENLSRMVKADSEMSRQIPDFIDLVQSVLGNLEREPVTVGVVDSESGEHISITVGKYDLQLLTANALGRIGIRDLPAHYLAMAQGNFSWLAKSSLSYRINSKTNLMPIAVDCASGDTEERRRNIMTEAENTVLGDAINGIGFEICDSVGCFDLGDAFRGPLISKVPTMLISGTLDARTPVGNAEEVMQTLANVQHLVVDGATHNMFQEAGSQINPIISQYFKGDPLEPISSTTIVALFEFASVK